MVFLGLLPFSPHQLIGQIGKVLFQEKKSISVSFPLFSSFSGGGNLRLLVSDANEIII